MVAPNPDVARHDRYRRMPSEIRDSPMAGLAKALRTVRDRRGTCPRVSLAIICPDSFEGKHEWNGVEAHPLPARVLKP